MHLLRRPCRELTQALQERRRVAGTIYLHQGMKEGSFARPSRLRTETGYFHVRRFVPPVLYARARAVFRAAFRASSGTAEVVDPRHNTSESISLHMDPVGHGGRNCPIRRADRSTPTRRFYFFWIEI